MATTPVLNSASALAFPFDAHTVRAVLRDGEPWFVAADVCAALDLGNPSMALRRLDADETALSSIEVRTPTGGMTENTVNLINESGLYSLVLGSRKPEAKRFKKWVTSEVLPQIRKTGRYAAPSTMAFEPGTRWNAHIDAQGRMVLTPALTPQEYVAELAKAIASPTGGGWGAEHLLPLAEAIHASLARDARRIVAMQQAARQRQEVPGPSNAAPHRVARQQEIRHA